MAKHVTMSIHCQAEVVRRTWIIIIAAVAGSIDNGFSVEDIDAGFECVHWCHIEPGITTLVSPSDIARMGKQKRFYSFTLVLAEGHHMANKPFPG